MLIAFVFVPVALADKVSLAEKADKLFNQKQYLDALEKYEEAYRKVGSNKIEKNRIYFQMGECYRLTHNFPKAESIYRRLIGSKYYNTEPKVYFYLAEMYRFEGKFEEADNMYGEYLNLVPDDQLGRSRKASIIYVSELINNRTRHHVSRVTKWNSEYNDWAPRFWGSDTTRFVFTSSRFGNSEDGDVDAWTGQAFSDLYYVFCDRRGEWSATPESFDTKGRINTSVNEGEPCFSPDGRTVYFSRCDARKNQTQGCYIYKSTYGEKEEPEVDNTTKKKNSKVGKDGQQTKKDTKKPAKKKKRKKGEIVEEEWGEPQRVYLGDTSYNYLYPAVTSDGLTLYFSSDMPGGQGDYDLWVAHRNNTDEDFGEPVNLGSAVNTAGREVFPILRYDSVMYFSSNGLPGVGGMDLFRTEVSGTYASEPKNLGVPINSSFDEMSILYYPDDETSPIEERGYFSSNRPFDDPHNKNIENKGKKIDNINDDLFYFTLDPLNYSIQGTIRDEKSMQLVSDAKVKLIGSDGSENDTYSDAQGRYRFGSDIVRRNVVYKLIVSKVDYFTIDGSESTRGYNTNKDIVHDFRIEPVPRQAIVLPEIRYDLSKWDLKEEFMDSLMDLYLVMVNNPSLVVEIRAHTDCRPFLGLTNDTLSQRRAQSVVDYLVSRGIERDRMVAKGYGEREPRLLDKDVIVRIDGEAYTFSEGTLMECDYISHLPEGNHQEAAHMLNRRIEFKVLRTDYVSKRLIDNMVSDTPLAKQTEDGRVIDLVNKPIEEEESLPEIIHSEDVINVTMIHSAKGEINCIVNGSQTPMLVDERYNEPISMSWEEAMSFLYQRRINKEDFPDRDNAFDPEGNILDRATVIFKELQIGQKKLHNIEVVIVKGVEYKFIISRKGLAQFGEYEFDKQRGKIYFLD
ncbi:MAG: PD40 domain-containing protein [Bacteroidales bacterium]|nr:PD40 domain-containing protein [Candidatus Colimorpha onthohippi]